MSKNDGGCVVVQCTFGYFPWVNACWVDGALKEFFKGDKVAQIIIERTYSGLPLYEVDSLEETDRGSSGIDDAEMRLR